MNDMTAAIVPKSDQISADDLISGPITIEITGVTIRPGTEQPVSIAFAGESRPWRPCKSMSRVLVGAWGPDANKYVGRRATLYRDPAVKWGGLEVGGIRVSHLSHIDAKMVMALTATRGQRKPFLVEPLEPVQAKPKKGKSPVDLYALELTDELGKAAQSEDAQAGIDALNLWWSNTAERRMALNIPADREEKMRLAVAKIVNPDASA